MGKALTPIDHYYINNHVGKMTIEQLAKQIGCTARTVYNYIAKTKGEARTPEGRDSIKNVPNPVEPTLEEREQAARQASLPPKGEFTRQLIGKRKHGDSAAIAMTPELSQIGDDINKMGPTKKYPDYIHVIQKDEK